MEKYSRTHKVKIEEAYYENVISGRKRFEIRYDDRDYQVGDWLHLSCADRGVMVEIIYKTTFKQQDHYCVLGFELSTTAPKG